MTATARPALLPLVPLYRFALGLRELRLRTGLEPVRRLRTPVVSVGGLSTGGAGKTPMTIALARALTARGLRVDVLSRGFGRQGRAAVRVDPNGAARDFGDEPLLIAREAGVPVYVAARRYEAGLLAEADADEQAAEKLAVLKGHDFSRAVNSPESIGPLGPEGCFSGLSRGLASFPAGRDAPIVHLLDDGFQHRQLHRDVNILLLDENLFSERLLPAGNLREPITAMRRADMIAIPAGDAAASLESNLRSRGWQGPIWRVHRRMEAPPCEGLVAAFCGIALPEQFFAGLEAAGLRLAARIAFPDHRRYTARELNRVQVSARSAGAEAIVTTEKDRVRLGSLTELFPESLPLRTATLRIEIEDEAAAMEWLERRMGAHR